MRNVADTGLNILFQLLQNVSGNPEAAQSFYQTYYTDILQHMFSVVTDTSHTAGLTMHATILAYIFALVESGKVSVSKSIRPGRGSVRDSNRGVKSAKHICYPKIIDWVHISFFSKIVGSR